MNKLSIFSVFTIALVLLVGLSGAAQVLLSEPINSCSKATYSTPSLVGAGALNFFLGETFTVDLSVQSSNYNYYLSTFGSPQVQVHEIEDNGYLYETVCGSAYGRAYANGAAIVKYSPSDVESLYGIAPNSLYVESFENINLLGLGPFEIPNPKAAFMAYKIPNAQIYMGEGSNIGPYQSWLISAPYNPAPYTQYYRDISVEVDPFYANRGIIWMSAMGPLPSNTQISFTSSSNPPVNGVPWTYTFTVPVPPIGSYDVYHLQALDNNFVGVTDTIVITA